MGELEGSAAWGTSPSLLDRILAIEAEAAAAERKRLRALWKHLQGRRAGEMHDVGHMARVVETVLLAEPSQ